MLYPPAIEFASGLKWTHCCKGPEMVVKGGDRHTGYLREFFDTKWPRIVCLYPRDRFGRAMTLAA